MDPVLNLVGRHLTKEKMHLVCFLVFFLQQGGVVTAHEAEGISFPYAD